MGWADGGLPLYLLYKHLPPSSPWPCRRRNWTNRTYGHRPWGSPRPCPVLGSLPTRGKQDWTIIIKSGDMGFKFHCPASASPTHLSFSGQSKMMGRHHRLECSSEWGLPICLHALQRITCAQAFCCAYISYQDSLVPRVSDEAALRNLGPSFEWREEGWNGGLSRNLIGLSSALVARASITKDRQNGLNNRNLFFTSGGWKSKIKLSAGLIPSEASRFGLQMAIYSLCPNLFLEGHIGLGPTLITSD